MFSLCVLSHSIRAHVPERSFLFASRSSSSPVALRAPGAFMKRFLASVLCGLAAAASVSFAVGQQVTAQTEEVYHATDGTVRATKETVYATNKDNVEEIDGEEIVHVGFMHQSSEDDDPERDQYSAALETDSLLTSERRIRTAFCERTWSKFQDLFYNSYIGCSSLAVEATE